MVVAVVVVVVVVAVTEMDITYLNLLLFQILIIWQEVLSLHVVLHCAGMHVFRLAHVSCLAGPMCTVTHFT